MRRKLDTIAWCKSIFAQRGVSEKELATYFERSTDILSNYRYVVWSLNEEVRDFYIDIQEMASAQLYEALEYLSEFAPKKDRGRFNDRVSSFVWSEKLVSIIDTVLVRVVNYPLMGQIYQELLSKNYFTKFEYTDNEIAEILQMSPSTYYRRKKEAKYLFATALFMTFFSTSISANSEDFDSKLNVG